MPTIAVNIRQNAYAIHVSGAEDEDWTEPVAEIVQGLRPIVLTNPRVARLCLPALKRGLARRKIPVKTLLIPDGESFKNLETVAKAHRGLVRLGADRATPVLLLGGGVVGDLGGFVAATYLRGVPFVQIGTTLVAQVDSSIGGKLGVDLPEGKNLVGVFGQPKAVVSHVPFLKTLPRRELAGGLGEVLKYGVIRDPGLFETVRKDLGKIYGLDDDLLLRIVQRSSAIKAEVVAADERESSLRMILNFGHTFGHALERLTKYRRYHHGEAVGFGMVTAARLSERLGFCSRAEAERVRGAVAEAGLPTEAPPIPKARWRAALEVDKKSRGGMIHFVFMTRVGEVVTQPVAPKELAEHFARLD
ncbi:MAG TPA: 3-dehydroquinate synthase [bacterium]|nr:3-dehydroquinate synthase [bacterium]